MKVLFLLALFAAGNAPVISQANPYLGGQLGLNTTRTRQTEGPATSFERRFRTGFTAGGWMHLRYWKPVFPRFELSYTRRGTNFFDPAGAPGPISMDYVDFTIMAQVEQPIYEVVLFAAAGPQLSLLLRAYRLEDDEAIDIKEFVSTVDLGFAAVVGVATKPTRWGTLSLQGRYDMGFLDASKLESNVLNNLGISVLIGYEYRRAPEPPRDSDGDGIFDDKDRCPSQAEDKNEFEDDDGCPDASKDDDGDGVFDPVDQCPTEPEDKNEFEDDDGCPDASKDDDGDGVFDPVDQCPTEPEDDEGAKDPDGCPDPGKNDGGSGAERSSGKPNGPSSRSPSLWHSLQTLSS